MCTSLYVHILNIICVQISLLRTYKKTYFHTSLFVWLVADVCCWFVLREKY
jgi:hypothetical protein